MSSSQLRILLNSLAGLLTTGAAAALALGHPVIALGATNAVAFFAGWANLTKPGDVKAKDLIAPAPELDETSADAQTPPPTGPA